ncbi:MAG: Queuine tRNA-ribosyltransferase [Parcubacteria group bacterium GW2011_GWA2_43_13]|nr:MAG: Queuine tRNA-ribosyltransferase [Parcubacteria group bacterium GW2011_GWA2_43_13]HAZ16584.1 tRNA guanosine(34) transglycosylase Tgt [Candidatus Jacksonbacteria bacterium]
MIRKLAIITPHGELRTPFFMPIATKGAVKSLTTRDLEQLGATIILSNTYHMYLRPGEECLKEAGGLHGFMKWDKPILTDSGGYQVFSLGRIKRHSSHGETGLTPSLQIEKSLVRITNNGVEFRDHISGAKHFFTPERVLEIQDTIGSDIRMVLDVCSEYPCTHEKAGQDMERTLRWAERSLKYKQKNKGDYLLFAIVQGGMYQDLREQCARTLVDMPFDGYAIGGVSVGEPWEEARKVLDWVIPILPEDKPRYLMGVGKPEQVIEAYKKGIDMFDCVIPTREARHGRLYLPSVAPTSITNEQYKNDFSPIHSDSQLEELRTYTKAYLRHLFISQEPLALRLATLNNIETYLSLFK